MVNSRHVCSDNIVLLLKVGVLPQNDEVLQNGRLRQVHLAAQLGFLPLADQHGRVVLREASYLAGAAGLADRVDGRADADLGGNRLHFLVHRDKHAGVDAEGQVVEEVVVFAGDEVGDIRAAVDSGQEAGEGNIREEELIGVQGVETQQALQKLVKKSE